MAAGRGLAATVFTYRGTEGAGPDIEQFFPNVGLDDLVEALTYLEERIEKEFPKMQWF